MIYDLIAIFNFAACLYALYLGLVLLSRSRKKVYQPPEIRKRYRRGIRAYIAIPSVSLGAIVRVVLYDLHKDSLFALFSTIACVAIVTFGLQFLFVFKEKEVYIKDDALSADINDIERVDNVH